MKQTKQLELMIGTEPSNGMHGSDLATNLLLGKCESQIYDLLLKKINILHLTFIVSSSKY